MKTKVKMKKCDICGKLRKNVRSVKVFPNHKIYEDLCIRHAKIVKANHNNMRTLSGCY